MNEAPLFIALAVSGALLAVLFGCAEAGLYALGELRLRAISESKGRWSSTAARVLRENGGIHTRLLLGRVLGLSMLVVVLAQVVSEHRHVPWIWLFPVPVLLLYGLLIQLGAAFVRHRADDVALRLLRWVHPLELLVMPFAAPMVWLARFFAGRAEPHENNTEEVRIAEREVEQAIEQGCEEGVLTQEHAALLRSALEFKHTVAREVMVPRRRIVGFALDTPLDEVLRKVGEEGHSRYPIYRERLDQIEGMLFAKDLLRALLEGQDLSNMTLEDFVRRPVSFYEESEQVGAILRGMQQSRSHLAMVIDEFGGTSGLITLEDLLEEIVGEIQDEDDEEQSLICKVSEGRYLVDASVSLFDVEAVLGESLHDDSNSCDSVGGLVIEKSGKMPNRGDRVEAGPFDIVVRRADTMRIFEVELVRRTNADPVHISS